MLWEEGFQLPRRIPLAQDAAATISPARAEIPPASHTSQRLLGITRKLRADCSKRLFGVLVALLFRMRRELVGPVGMERATTLLTVVVLQGGLGYLQYVTGVPPLLVGLHVLGSMLVWMASLRLYLTLTEPIPAEARSVDLSVGSGAPVLPGAPG